MRSRLCAIPALQLPQGSPATLSPLASVSAAMASAAQRSRFFGDCSEWRRYDLWMSRFMALLSRWSKFSTLILYSVRSVVLPYSHPTDTSAQPSSCRARCSSDGSSITSTAVSSMVRAPGSCCSSRLIELPM
jgi:hypothetical protein